MTEEFISNELLFLTTALQSTYLAPPLHQCLPPWAAHCEREHIREYVAEVAKRHVDSCNIDNTDRMAGTVDTPVYCVDPPMVAVAVHREDSADTAAVGARHT